LVFDDIDEKRNRVVVGVSDLDVDGIVLEIAARLRDP
jgi:hypothetical protein